MSPEVINRLSDRITWRGKSLGVLDNDLEDLQQDLLARYIEKGSGQTIDQAIIDWLRKNYGRKRDANFDAKRQFINATQFNEIERSIELPEWDRADLYRQLANLGASPFAKALYVLTRVCGYNEDEVTYFTSTAKGRLRERIKRVESCLYENAQKASRDCGKTEKILEELLPEKTNGDWW